MITLKFNATIQNPLFTRVPYQKTWRTINNLLLIFFCHEKCKNIHTLPIQKKSDRFFFIVIIIILKYYFSFIGREKKLNQVETPIQGDWNPFNEHNQVNNGTFMQNWVVFCQFVMHIIIIRCHEFLLCIEVSFQKFSEEAQIWHTREYFCPIIIIVLCLSLVLSLSRLYVVLNGFVVIIIINVKFLFWIL